MRILKQTTQPVSVSIRVPAELAKRLSDARAVAAQRGLSLDVDQPLTKVLARLVKQAEAELSDAPAAAALENERAEVPHVAC